MAGRSSLQRIYHNQHFHKVIIHRCAGGLDNEAVLTTDTFIDHDLNFAVVEPSADSFSQRHSDVVGNFLCQRRVCVSCKNLQFRSIFHVHFAASPFPFKYESVQVFLISGYKPSHPLSLFLLYTSLPVN